MTAAYLGGRGTPMFLVNEWLLVGAQPFETFQKVIGQALELSKNKPKPGAEFSGLFNSRSECLATDYNSRLPAIELMPSQTDTANRNHTRPAFFT